MALIDRYTPEIDYDIDGFKYAAMNEDVNGSYVHYGDHLAVVQDLQDQIKALSIKQAPY